jgi:di/tricarboxylate transporter
MLGLNPHAAATMLLTVGALFLFTRERLSLHLSCLTVLLVLVAGFELFPYAYDGDRLGASDFLAGFGNEALVTIVLLLILAKGVEVSGALRPLTRMLARLWFFNAPLALLVTLITAAFLSAFVNNTPIVVILLPLLIGVTHRTGATPSKILMPVGFATIVGGMSTTIGTSTNLLVVSVAADLGGPQIGMFDFILPAAIAASVAIIYLWLVAPKLLPERVPPLTRSTPRVFESVIEVTEGSSLAGKTLADVRGLLRENIRIERVQRGEGLDLVRLPTLTLRPDDRLHVRGTAEAIKDLQNLFGGGFQDDDLLRLPDQVLVEIVVTRDSPLYGKTLAETRGTALGQLIPIGTLRPGGRTSPDFATASVDRRLETGDVLLMQGRRQEIRELQDRHQLLILDRNVHVPRSAKAPLAVSIMIGVVVAAAFGWMPILASALCGATLMLLLRCLSLEEAGGALDTRLILVIVTSLALGTALTSTGAVDAIAIAFVDLVRNLPPPVVLSAILLLTALLTEIVTNNAIAVIGTPIAVVVARELGSPEIPFVLAVLFGANMSYLTPIGYQTNLLVFSAGGYRFGDFFRAGIPLQIILWLALSIALPMLYF